MEHHSYEAFSDEREKRERERANFENVTLALLTLHLIWTDFLLVRTHWPQMHPVWTEHK
jgi:hypothetical protein